MKRIALLMLCLGLSASCVQPKSAPEPVQDETPKIQWERQDDAKISFIRMHPGAPQKNTYIDWELFKTNDIKDASGAPTQVWRVADKEISDEARQKLSELIESVDADLIASDGIYTCRYQPNQPQYRLEFSKDSHHYKVISSSDCLNGVPFNVQIDDKLYLQMNGKIGIALQNAIQSVGSTLNVGGSEALIQFVDPITVEGYANQGEVPPNVYYDKLMRQNEELNAFLEAAQKLDASMQPPEVACNQSKSADCSEISARYTVKAAENALIHQNVKVSKDGIAFTQIQPAMLERLDKIRETRMFKAFAELHKDDVIMLLADKNQDCKLVSGLAKFFSIPEKEIKNLSCHTWTLTVKDQPSLIYYEGLDAFWPEQSADHQFPVLEHYCADKKLPKATIQSICKKFKPDAGTNIFVRANDKVVKFVVQNGQTILAE